ncbi:zinc-binding dehydrogenase [Nocardiopsis halophila]|uniref:zinc-binding dehydrogenase n=1 Tax=Nocardiopsis halophila TaxID=141692 RepID=UPI000A30C016|nr:zinc-binding dehydrogenase [Nocardiopsis halophila]
MRASGRDARLDRGQRREHRGRGAAGRYLSSDPFAGEARRVQVVGFRPPSREGEASWWIRTGRTGPFIEPAVPPGGPCRPPRASLAEAVRLISRGALHIPVDMPHTLAEAAQAHSDSRSGHTRGRGVIVVRPLSSASALPRRPAALRTPEGQQGGPLRSGPGRSRMVVLPLLRHAGRGGSSTEIERRSG